MWLLSTDRAELHYFLRNFDATGGYAILSHTWNGDEQTLQQVRAIGERCRASGTNPRDDPALSQKIRNCCILAERYGYRWVWIDSCCIDKTSSSELSEAINSMFQWYKEAEVCFAYLADVPSDCAVHATASAFRKSRWHTRGWTLQELIAPDFLIFLSDNWNELGNRANLAGLLEEITTVPSGVLTGEHLPAGYSVSIRMSWASRRKTTRVEDDAYCLMGLFEVNMPTNYGEGKKAFIRLQYEIMQHNPDMSLFAFGGCVQQDHGFMFHPKEEPRTKWRYLLADSPREFTCGFVYIPDVAANTEPQYPPSFRVNDQEYTGSYQGGVELPRAAMTSYGVELRVPVFEADGITVAITLCQKGGRHVGLCLTRDSCGRDPTRPRYFTGCVYSAPDIGLANLRCTTRLADLGSGDNLYDLTFNRKRVQASWRTIYIVTTISHLDTTNSTTPNLTINCDPTSHIRVPRWLVARFTALQFTVQEMPIPHVGAKTLKALEFFLDGVVRIFVSFGSCTYGISSASNPQQLPVWARVDVLLHHQWTNAFSHNCCEDHIDSKSWASRSKFFGDPDRGVQLSLMQSTWTSGGPFMMHIELLGRILRERLSELGGVSMFPSLADLKGNAPHPGSSSTSYAATSRPLSQSQIPYSTSDQAPSSSYGSMYTPHALLPAVPPPQPGPVSDPPQGGVGIYSSQLPDGDPSTAAGAGSPCWQAAPPPSQSTPRYVPPPPPPHPYQHPPGHGLLPTPSWQGSWPYTW